ncbi:hypothetical protein CALCODRAFT_499032 [Calocera cornea HHB12733]|uniref:Uncharacterized protein n=1 Tax=Calocera cornea HHB12733 TaxID=1353952 RepID=A0A165ELB1_9BASI|nr:hypothetical protein CALCODRAFT_499032 [Calocera cornea HHB12733]
MPKITDAEPAVERRPSAPSAPPHAPHLSQQPPSGSSTGTGGKRPTPVKRACDQVRPPLPLLLISPSALTHPPPVPFPPCQGAPTLHPG